MENSVDSNYKSRILKCGKISLVVSALLLSVSTQSIASSSSDITINDANTTGLSGSYGDINITSNGSITNLNGNGIGIKANPFASNGTILNNGSITVTSTDIHTNATGIDVENMNDTASIVNNGTIAVNSNARGRGIFIMNMNDTASIVNSGTISIVANKGTGIITNKSNGFILNSGTISIVANKGTGIIANNGTGSVLNSGTISIVANDHSYGIYSAGDTNITNSGTIDVRNASGEFFEDGYSFTGKSITNTSTGIMNGNIYAEGTVTNSGTISLANATADIDIFKQTATGTLKVILDHDGTSPSNSKILAENATIADNSNFFVDVTSGAKNNSSTLLDTNLTIITASNSLSVDASTQNVDDNSLIFNFKAWKTGNNFGFTVVKGASIEDTIKKAGTSLQSGGAAKVLDNIPAGNPDIDKFKRSLPDNTKAAALAVAGATPTATVDAATLGGQLINTMSSVVQARQASVRGFSSGDVAFSDKNIWFKPFGGYTNQDNVDGITGFKANSFGLGFGVDGEYKAGSRVGLALFYTKADVDTNDIDQTSDLDVFTLIAYGSNPILDDKTNLFYQIGYAYQTTDTSRVVSGVKTATSDYNAQSLYLQLKATRDVKINDSFIIKPALVTSYTYFKN